MQTFVIVGGGLAGAKTAQALRDNGFDDSIVLFSTEPHLPYERPALSKDYLLGTKTLDDITVAPASWYRDHNVDLRLGTTITGIDRQTHRVTFAGGSQSYDKLLLATGSSSRRPPIPGRRQ